MFDFPRLHAAGRRACAPLLLLVVSAAASAAPLAVLQAAPQNVVNLSAEASREVLQDQLAITLAATREGSEAAAVQSQLRQALDSALAEARKAVRPGALELHTGAFSVYPRYASRPGGGSAISGWQGRAELVIEGNDTAAISQLAGRLNGMTVARVAFSLSREAREKVEAEVAAQAIVRFKARAESVAQQFGFGSYSLREVTVGGGEAGGMPPPIYRAQAMSARATEEAQPVEPGRTTVSVTVSGSIQLSPR
jgi:predicted secreted protein